MYKEVNPAIFAQVTFPFLFGVMFGDMGHGSLLFIFALLITFFAEKLKGTFMAPFVLIRYFLLLMGFFAMYNGLIYNEVFSMPVEFFDSCYTQ
jgi:V-type H+-transporting ATPase subunit a